MAFCKHQERRGKVQAPSMNELTFDLLLPLQVIWGTSVGDLLSGLYAIPL